MGANVTYNPGGRTGDALSAVQPESTLNADGVPSAGGSHDTGAAMPDTDKFSRGTLGPPDRRRTRTEARGPDLSDQGPLAPHGPTEYRSRGRRESSTRRHPEADTDTRSNLHGGDTPELTLLAPVILRNRENKSEDNKERAYLPTPVWSGFTIPEILDCKLEPAGSRYLKQHAFLSIETKPANISGVCKCGPASKNGQIFETSYSASTTNVGASGHNLVTIT